MFIGEAFDKLKSFVTIDSDLDLEGHKTITGLATIEEMISSDNIATSDEHNSLKKALQEALRLTDKEILNRMTFSQQLNVDEVKAGRINNIDARLLVVNGGKQSQVVKGWKKFRGDLEITGDTRVGMINGIDMDELERNILKKDGDQNVEGKHSIQFVTADGG